MSNRRIRSDLTNDIEYLRRKNNEITRQILQNGWFQNTIQLLRQALPVLRLRLAIFLFSPFVRLIQSRDHKSCSVTQSWWAEVSARARFGEVSPRLWSFQSGFFSSRPNYLGFKKRRRSAYSLAIRRATSIEFENEDDGLYIVLSHVWAYGVGNLDNTMPLCQFRRPQRFLKEMQGASSASNIWLIWMDALCAGSRSVLGFQMPSNISNCENIP